MPEPIIAAAQFGNYISIVKFVVFLVLFFPCMLLVRWVYDDAKAVRTDQTLWTGIILAASALGALVWLLIPVFFAGLALYLIAVGAASVSYVMHRNAKVTDFERILTAEHLRSLFTNQEKKIESLEDLSFITANNNEVPVPEPRTPEFFGFKMAYDIFTDAIYRRASDVILTPAQDSYGLHYIVDGATIKQPSVPRGRAENFSDFLKQLADLDIDEKRKPQKGMFRLRKDEGSSQWEVNTAGSTAGEHIKIRQITQLSIARLSEISLSPEQYEHLNAIGRMKKGLFVVSGPKRSGVTTTFYALIRNHDAFINSVNTLELHPSADLPNVTQNVFSLSDSGTTTYAKKLLSIVRMSPDVLGVADITDAESAKVAAQAAKDGATVYITLEADSVPNALAKLIKLVGDRNFVAETLIGLSNQRLFRKLCPECKQAYEPNRELLVKFNIPPDRAKVLYRAGKVVYSKRGKPSPCDNCQETGFFGRTCAFETVMVNDELKKAILSARSLSDLAMQLRKTKMKYLQEQILDKVLDGTTSVNEMVRIFSGHARPKAKRKT